MEASQSLVGHKLWAESEGTQKARVSGGYCHTAHLEVPLGRVATYSASNESGAPAFEQPVEEVIFGFASVFAGSRHRNLKASTSSGARVQAIRPNSVVARRRLAEPGNHLKINRTEITIKGPKILLFGEADLPEPTTEPNCMKPNSFLTDSNEESQAKQRE